MVCLLQLLTKSLDVVDSEDWTAEVGEAFGSQVGHYVNMPHEKVRRPALCCQQYCNTNISLVFITLLCWAGSKAHL
jgi:hypothetical protein